MIITIIASVVSAVAGAFASYLFLRANAQKKAALDKLTSQVSAKL